MAGMVDHKGKAEISFRNQRKKTWKRNLKGKDKVSLNMLYMGLFSSHFICTGYHEEQYWMLQWSSREFFHSSFASQNWLFSENRYLRTLWVAPSFLPRFPLFSHWQLSYCQTQKSHMTFIPQCTNRQLSCSKFQPAWICRSWFSLLPCAAVLLFTCVWADFAGGGRILWNLKVYRLRQQEALSWSPPA